MARLTSSGALCGPLPARGFPNTEDMVRLLRGTRVVSRRALSSVPARRDPAERIGGSPRARGLGPVDVLGRGPGVERQAGYVPAARPSPARRRSRRRPAGGAARRAATLLVRAAGAPRRACSSPLPTLGRSRPAAHPTASSASRAGHCHLPGLPRTLQGRTKTGEVALGRGLEGRDVSSLI